MYGSGFKPLKGSGIRWIDHKIDVHRAFKQLCGDYQKFKCVCNSCRQVKEALEAKVLLRAAFFTDILAEAKRLSLITQEKNFKVIKMLNAVHELRESVKKDKKKQ